MTSRRKASILKQLQDVRVEQVIRNEPYTAAIVTARHNGLCHEASGFAKLKPGDTWSDELGMKIAVGRALHNIYEMVYAHMSVAHEF